MTSGRYGLGNCHPGQKHDLLSRQGRLAVVYV